MMLGALSENTKKVMCSLIHPQFRRRSMEAIVRETGLTEEVVLDVVSQNSSFIVPVAEEEGTTYRLNRRFNSANGLAFKIALLVASNQFEVPEEIHQRPEPEVDADTTVLGHDEDDVQERGF